MAAHVPSRLYRSRSQKMLAGVCGGLGEYFDVDPVLIRLLFVVTTFISGAGILAYIVLWIVVPFEGGDTSRMDTFKRDFDDLTGRVRDFVDPPRTGAPASGTAPRGEPDVTGYHGSYGPEGYGPGGYGQQTGASSSGPFSAPGQPASAADQQAATPGRAPSGATPFSTSRDASMPSDSTSARVPGADTTPPPSTGAPSSAATADRPADPSADSEPIPAGPAAASGTPSGSAAPVDDTPLEIEPPAGPPPGASPNGPSSGSSAGVGAGAGAPFGAGTSSGGVPPFGSPFGQGSGASFGQGSGTPPFGTPFGGPAGGPARGAAGGPFGGPFGGPSGGPSWGPSGDSSFGGGASTGAPFVGAPPSERKRRRQHWAGALLILIGLMILGNNLGLLWWVKMQYLMPLLLVGVGAWLLFGRGRRG